MFILRKRQTWAKILEKVISNSELSPPEVSLIEVLRREGINYTYLVVAIYEHVLERKYTRTK